MLNSKKITNIILILCLAVFLFGSGYQLGEYKAKNQVSDGSGYPNSFFSQSQPEKIIDFSLFWETWNKLKQKFIDQKKINPIKMYYGAIKGMVASLEDPYTFFLTPDENRQSKEDLGGRFEGIGAELGLRDGRIIVVAPLKNSPAEQAGVRAGDFINKVDGQSTKNWPVTRAVAAIRGRRGTKVSLTLERNTKEFTVEIVRNVINVPSMELTYESQLTCKKDKNKKDCPQVAYLKVNQFGDNTSGEWDKAVDEVRAKWIDKQIRGMILDLRDNPGGYLDGSVYLASDFLPEGKLVVKQESTTYESREYRVERDGKLLDTPLVVIVNKGSASASEILAGALQDYKRATLVGDKTFGKGSVQEALDLKEGAGLHVTVAKWILPDGEWINNKGIEPDIKVENKLTGNNTLTRETDLQLEKSVGELVK